MFQCHHIAVSAPKLVRKDGRYNMAKNSKLLTWWANTSRHIQTYQNPSVRDMTGSFKSNDWCPAHIAMFQNPNDTLVQFYFMVAVHELHSCLSWGLRMRDFPGVIPVNHCKLDRWWESLSIVFKRREGHTLSFARKIYHQTAELIFPKNIFSIKKS